VRRSFYDLGNRVASEQAQRALTEGKSVIMDRYFPSTIAYGAADQINTPEVSQLILVT